MFILFIQGDFTIEEGGNICCCGKIFRKEENLLNVQNLIVENEIQNKDFEVVLTAKDIYKDMRAIGYDYGSKFQRLLSVKTNDFKTIQGEIEWDGNWITFMDAILQSMITAFAFRKMMVPVMIRSLRCDPRVLFDAIDANKIIEEEKEAEKAKKHAAYEKRLDAYERGEELEGEEKDKIEKAGISDNTKKDIENEWKDMANEEGVEEIFEDINKDEYRLFKANIPLYIDLTSRLIVTHGVEIEDLIAVPIPRKANIADLKIESYEFLANEDSMAIEDSDKKELLEYIKV